MTKTRFFLHILLFALGFSACGLNETPVTTDSLDTDASTFIAETSASETVSISAPDTWTMNFPGTEWGMTPEEVCAALSIGEGEYEASVSENYYMVDGVRMDVFDGKNAYVTFTFDDQNEDEVFTLFRIEVVYPYDTDMESVRSFMKQRYGEPAETSLNKLLWESEALQQDIMSEAEAEFLNAQNSTAQKILHEPATTVSWTTNSYRDYLLDNMATKNLLIFNSSIAFYTHEDGFTPQMETIAAVQDTE